MAENRGLVYLEPRGLRQHAPAQHDELRERLQALTSSLANEEETWNEPTRREVRTIFDERAGTWDTRRSSAYLFPLVDALRRGSVPNGGTCLEVGSGTGIQTPTLAAHFDRIAAMDLSLEMLRGDHCHCAARLCADGATLPFPESSVDALVCVNVFVFPKEFARVLAPSGVLVHVSTFGDHTPIFLPPPEVLRALQNHDMAFSAVSAHAAEGTWTVVARRPSPTEDGNGGAR